jgi:solute:Na+ symporter, SSS family
MLAVGVILYLTATLAIGFFAGRRIKNNRDFSLAGKNLSWFMATATVFATWFGSETLLGSSANFVRDGFSGVIEEPFGAALCLILVGAIFARRLYKMNLDTFGDYFRVRYGVPAEIASSLILAVSYVSWVAAQFLALGIVFSTVTGVSVEVSVVAMAALVTIYTTLGGMWAVSLTDSVQMVLIVGGLVGVFWYLLAEAGGFSAVIATAPPSHFSMLPPGKVNWWQYVTLWMVLGFGSVPGQDVFQRIMSSKNANVAAVSSILAGLFYLTIAMIPLFLGLIAVKMLTPAELPADMQYILPRVILLKTPTAVQILFFGALLSAILSTASGALLAPSVLISGNLLTKIFKPDDRRTLLFSRLATIGVAVWAVQMTLTRRHIHSLVTESSAIGLVSLFVPFVAGFFTKIRAAKTAAASILAGYAVWIFWPRIAVWFNLQPAYFPDALAGLAASLVPFILLWAFLSLRWIVHGSVRHAGDL